MLTVCRRTVREQLDVLPERREHQSRPHHNTSGPAMFLFPPPCTLMVSPNQKQQLQQQVQQVSSRELPNRFTADNKQTHRSADRFLDFPRWSESFGSYRVVNLWSIKCITFQMFHPCSDVTGSTGLCKDSLYVFVFQHVQLLTQVNMLCSSVEALKSQATTTKLFLVRIYSLQIKIIVKGR